MPYRERYKTTALACLGVLAAAAISASTARAMLNPAVVYCLELGYTYYTAQSRRGLLGVCELPDGQQVNAWSFYRGKVAPEWSYCALQGYPARRDESGEVCWDCLVCVVSENQEIPVDELMGLTFRESKCGDGQCGTAEDYASCPSDCPSGREDELCDGAVDARCDPDCVLQGGLDPDCPKLFVDLAPGACPNPLAMKSRGALSAALLGTAGLKVVEIDPGSIRLSCAGCAGSVAPVSWEIKDVGTPNPAQDCSQCWTVPGDLKPDLVVQFDTRTVARMAAPLALRGQLLPFKVTATLLDGTEVWGEDCVKPVPLKGKP